LLLLLPPPLLLLLLRSPAGAVGDTPNKKLRQPAADGAAAR
jgi:hypothetical protein